MAHTSGNRGAALFGAAAFGSLLFALPIIMAPASKSAPLVFTIATALGLAACLTADGGVSLRGRLQAQLTTGAGRLACVILAFAAVSCFWSHPAAAAFPQYAMFAGMLVLATVAVSVFPSVAPRGWAVAGLAACAAVAVLMMVDLRTGLWLRNGLSNDNLAYRYNRGFVTLIILFWPMAALAVVERGRTGAVAACLAGALIAVSAFASESETAKVAAASGLAVFALAFVLPGLVRGIGLATTLALIALSPWIGTAAKSGLGQLADRFMKDAHAGDRIDIWISFEAALRHAWVVGHGFGSSLNMNRAPVAGLVPAELKTMLGASHPHNAFLQVWVELGLVGAASAAALAVLLFARVGRLAPRLQPFALTCIAVAMLIGLISHGAWQPWWIALLGAAAAIFAVAARDAPA